MLRRGGGGAPLVGRVTCDVATAAAERYERQYEVVVDQLPGFLHRLVNSVTNSVLARHQHTALHVATATAAEVTVITPIFAHCLF